MEGGGQTDLLVPLRCLSFGVETVAIAAIKEAVTSFAAANPATGTAPEAASRVIKVIGPER